MIGRASKPQASRTRVLLGLSLALASVIAILWLTLGEDVARVALLPSCAPIADAAPSTSVSVAEDEEPPPSAVPSALASVAPPAPALVDERASKPRITRVKGTVLDARTREPVPEITVVLRCGETSDRVQTAPDGSFESTVEFPAGTLSATLYDANQDVASFERDHKDGALELAWFMDAPIGPTYPIEIAGAELGDAASWKARIVESLRDPESAGEIDVSNDGLRIAADLDKHPDREWSWVPLRDGTTSWIRYPTIEFAPDAAYPLRLELRRDDPAFEADALVRSTVGIHPMIAVRAKPSARCASVEGEVHVDGARVPPDVELLLLPYSFDTGTTVESSTWDEARPEPSGRFRFERVLPGEKLLVAYAPNHSLERTALRVLRGENRAPAIRLVHALQDSVVVSVSAPIAAERRDRASGIAVQLRLVDAGSAGRAWLAFGSTPRLSADWTCVFRDLPAAQFELREIGLRAPPSWKPYGATVLAPRDLAPAVVDADAPKELRFEVHDNGSRRGSRRRSSSAVVSFGPGGCFLAPASSLRDRNLMMPADAPLEWTVWRSGCAPRFGTDADFRDVGGARVAVVELDEGWGAQIFFRAGRSNTKTAKAEKTDERSDERSPLSLATYDLLTAPPLAQVSVIADRESAVTSDAQGALRLSMRREPRRLSLRCNGWHLARLQSLAPKAGLGVESYLGWMERD